MRRINVTGKPKAIVIATPTAVHNASGTGASLFISSDPTIIKAGTLVQQGQVIRPGDTDYFNAGRYTVACADGCAATLVVQG